MSLTLLEASFTISYDWLPSCDRDVLVDDVRVRGALRGGRIDRHKVPVATAPVPPATATVSVYVRARARGVYFMRAIRNVVSHSLSQRDYSCWFLPLVVTEACFFLSYT
jgi:hypothetical protein